jgi:hypothetical protein
MPVIEVFLLLGDGVHMPSYGFFIFCIYCYPCYVRVRELFPETSWLWRLKLFYTKDGGEGKITARRRGLSQAQSLSVELTCTFEKAGSQLASPPASKAMESRDFDSAKSSGTT